VKRREARVSLFVDTSFIFALADEDDADHDRARGVFEGLDPARLRELCVCLSFVVMEKLAISEALTLDAHFTHRFAARPGPR
jgi:predicted nucleic acid-binding protein